MTKSGLMAGTSSVLIYPPVPISRICSLKSVMEKMAASVGSIEDGAEFGSLNAQIDISIDYNDENEDGLISFDEFQDQTGTNIVQVEASADLLYPIYEEVSSGITFIEDVAAPPTVSFYGCQYSGCRGWNGLGREYESDQRGGASSEQPRSGFCSNSEFSQLSGSPNRSSQKLWLLMMRWIAMFREPT